MIEAIIALINSRLATLDLFKDIKGVCEQIQKVEGEETLIFPAQYCEGEYTHIDDIANYEEGIAYHRQIGENTEETGEGPVIACGEEVTRAYPMRIVCLIPKNKLSQENNDQYIDDKLATNIANTLKIVNNKTIAETLKADVISVDIVSTQKDRYLVFEEEFTIPGKVPGFEFAFFFIDYTISITATQSCFENFDCDGFVVPEFCSSASITDSDGVTIFEVPSGGSGSCTPCSDVSILTCQQLNDDLIQTQRQLIQRVNLIKTGAVVSYGSNDDGAEQRGRLVNFLTLDCNNSFGDTNRFTDSVGGQDYDGTAGSIPNYVIDHATGLGWQFAPVFGSFPIANWATALANAAAHNNGTFSDFVLPNLYELFSLANFGTLRRYEYAPLNIITSLSLWSSTTAEFGSTFAFFMTTTAAVIMNAAAKTSARQNIYVRNHF